MESILTSIKKLLGIDEDYEAFDTDVIMHINSVLFILNQIGIGTEGFSITDKTSIWSEFMQNISAVELVKSYVYLKVRLLFDPPTSSSVIDAINRQLSEFEWRLLVYADPKVDYNSEEEIGGNNDD